MAVVAAGHRALFGWILFTLFLDRAAGLQEIPASTTSRRSSTRPRPSSGALGTPGGAVDDERAGGADDRR